MRFSTGFNLFLLVALASGCASHGQNRSVSYAETKAFHLSYNEQGTPVQQTTELLYTQPVNKVEPCKVITSQSQQERNNFRAYWDGQCKNGYAYGLGRDIAISDTHHYEEITVYKDNGVNYGSPSVFYDFVNNEVSYRLLGDSYGQISEYREFIKNDFNGFDIRYSIGKFDGKSGALVVEGSAFNLTKVLINADSNLAYRFSDSTAFPVIEPSNVAFLLEMFDVMTKQPTGFGIVKYGSGAVQHFKITGATPELVTLPPEYIADINEKYMAVLQAQAEANRDIDSARKMEREYLYLACNGAHSIKVLDEGTATKICTWRDQFKQPYNDALARYNQQLEQMKQRAQTAEQQRQIQQQIALQQQIIEQQQSQRAFQQGLNALDQLTQQMQRSTMQMQQQMMNQPMPQVAPLSMPGSNQIRCIHVGSTTNCRY